jgi:hypothetical protein
VVVVYFVEEFLLGDELLELLVFGGEDLQFLLVHFLEFGVLLVFFPQLNFEGFEFDFVFAFEEGVFLPVFLELLPELPEFPGLFDVFLLEFLGFLLVEVEFVLLKR